MYSAKVISSYLQQISHKLSCCVICRVIIRFLSRSGSSFIIPFLQTVLLYVCIYFFIEYLPNYKFYRYIYKNKIYLKSGKFYYRSRLCFLINLATSITQDNQLLPMQHEIKKYLR